MTGNVAILVGLCVPCVAMAANLTTKEVSMDDMDVGAPSYSKAKRYCDRMRGWYTAYVNHHKGVLYCLKRGVATNSNCNRCNTYRILVWKNGGGEEKHCAGRYGYNTKAGYIYPAHVKPCACRSHRGLETTLGPPCGKWSSNLMFPVTMKTWSFPESISWKIIH